MSKMLKLILARRAMVQRSLPAKVPSKTGGSVIVDFRNFVAQDQSPKRFPPIEVGMT
jgi:hypothetical protein